MKGKSGGTGALVLAALAVLALAIAAIWLSRGGSRSGAARPLATTSEERSEAAPPLRTPEVDAAARAAHAPAGANAAPAREAGPALFGPADMAVGQVAWGYVLDESGEPLEHARSWIRLVDALGEERKAETTPEGAWSGAGLAPGRWHAIARASGMRDAQAQLDLVAGAEPLRHDFQLVPQPEVRVRVLTRDGRPFFEVLREEERPTLRPVAVATREPPGAAFYGVSGSLNSPFGVGQFWENGQSDLRLPEDVWGVVRLDVDPPVHVSLVLNHAVLQTLPVAAGQTEVTFRLDPEEAVAQLSGLRLRAVDARGQPVAGASVDLRGGSWMQMPLPETGADGTLLLEPKHPGRYDLRIHARGHGMRLLHVELPAGEVLDLGELVLHDATPIRGRVVDASGAPRVALIALSPLPPPGEPPGWRHTTHRTNADGSFELDVGPGQWLLRSDAERSHMSPNVVADTRAGPIQDLELRLEPVSHAVLVWQGAERRGVELRFLDARGLVRQATRLWSDAPQRVQLPRGPWRAVALGPGGELLDQRDFELGSEPLRVELGPR